MFRSIFAVLAVLFATQTVQAWKAGFEIPPDKRSEFGAYIVEVRKAVTAACYTIKRRGGVQVFFRVSDSGAVTVDSVKASDGILEERVRAKIAKVRVPPPPAWLKRPVLFGVPIAFR